MKRLVWPFFTDYQRREARIDAPGNVIVFLRQQLAMQSISYLALFKRRRDIGGERGVTA